MDDKEIKYQIKPHFDFLYEMGMPTGRKIRNTIFILILFLIATIFAISKGNELDFANNQIINNIKVDKLLVMIAIIADIIVAIKLIANIIFQSMQYDHITYTFYDNMLVYEDDFLNQHRKNIEYRNVKEIEIRRTIWDRLLGYGIMVIYTNADNDRNNGLVIYSIKDPKHHYDIIYDLIHKVQKNMDNNFDSNIEKAISKTDEINLNDKEEIKLENEPKFQDEEDFKNNLKNINK